MKLALFSRIARHAYALACAAGLVGCGGAAYSLGTIPDDAGASPNRPPKSCVGVIANGVVASSGCDAGSGFSSTPTEDNGSADAGTISSGGATGDNGSSTDAGTSACTTAASVSCPSGTTGYSCSVNADPTNDLPNLVCSSRTVDGFASDYCCFPWPATAACQPDPGFPCGSNSYPFQCNPGTLPSSIDSKLTCGQNFPDSNGNNDFCCTFPL